MDKLSQYEQMIMEMIDGGGFESPGGDYDDVFELILNTFNNTGKELHIYPPNKTIDFLKILKYYKSNSNGIHIFYYTMSKHASIMLRYTQPDLQQKLLFINTGDGFLKRVFTSIDIDNNTHNVVAAMLFFKTHNTKVGGYGSTDYNYSFVDIFFNKIIIKMEDNNSIKPYLINYVKQIIHKNNSERDGNVSFYIKHYLCNKDTLKEFNNKLINLRDSSTFLTLQNTKKVIEKYLHKIIPNAMSNMQIKEAFAQSDKMYKQRNQNCYHYCVFITAYYLFKNQFAKEGSEVNVDTFCLFKFHYIYNVCIHYLLKKLGPITKDNIIDVNNPYIAASYDSYLFKFTDKLKIIQQIANENVKLFNDTIETLQKKNIEKKIELTTTYDYPKFVLRYNTQMYPLMCVDFDFDDDIVKPRQYAITITDYFINIIRRYNRFISGQKKIKFTKDGIIKEFDDAFNEIYNKKFKEYISDVEFKPLKFIDVIKNINYPVIFISGYKTVYNFNKQLIDLSTITNKEADKIIKNISALSILLMFTINFDYADNESEKSDACKNYFESVPDLLDWKINITDGVPFSLHMFYQSLIKLTIALDDPDNFDVNEMNEKQIMYLVCKNRIINTPYAIDVHRFEFRYPYSSDFDENQEQTRFALLQCLDAFDSYKIDNNVFIKHNGDDKITIEPTFSMHYNNTKLMRTFRSVISKNINCRFIYDKFRNKVNSICKLLGEDNSDFAKLLRRMDKPYFGNISVIEAGNSAYCNDIPNKFIHNNIEFIGCINGSECDNDFNITNTIINLKTNEKYYVVDQYCDIFTYYGPSIYYLYKDKSKAICSDIYSTRNKFTVPDALLIATTKFNYTFKPYHKNDDSKNFHFKIIKRVGVNYLFDNKEDADIMNTFAWQQRNMEINGFVKNNEPLRLSERSKNIVFEDDSNLFTEYHKFVKTIINGKIVNRDNNYFDETCQYDFTKMYSIIVKYLKYVRDYLTGVNNEFNIMDIGCNDLCYFNELYHFIFHSPRTSFEATWSYYYDYTYYFDIAYYIMLFENAQKEIDALIKKKDRTKYDINEAHLRIFGVDINIDNIVTLTRPFNDFDNFDDLFIAGNSETNKKLLFVKRMFEISFGGVVSNENVERVHHIYYNCDNKIVNILMGQGKSNIITPMLIYLRIVELILTDKIDKTNIVAIIVVPTHLKEQTIQIIKNLKYLFKYRFIYENTEASKIKVMSDTDFKDLYTNKLFHYETCIQSRSLLFYDLTNTYIIMDEVDTLMNPLTSNYNIECISNDEMEGQIKAAIDCKFIGLCTGTKEFNDIIQSKLKIAENDTSLDNMKINRDYGLGTFKDVVPFAVPYNGVASPIKNSVFNDSFAEIVLTYNIYFGRERIKAYAKPILNYLKKSYLKSYNLFTNLLIDCSDEEKKLVLCDNNDVNEQQMKFNKLLEEHFTTDKHINSLFLKRLFANIYKDNVKVISEYINTSFFSIINNKFLSNVKLSCFSGTTNVGYFFDYIDNDVKTLHNNAFIIKDIEEKSKKSAIEDTNNNHKLLFNEHIAVHKIKYGCLIDLWVLLLSKGFGAFIDCGALLRQSTPEEFIKIYAESFNKCDKEVQDKYFKYQYIAFVNNKDEKRVYDVRNNIVINDYQTTNDDVFYLYDNKHTVGIDIKQRSNVKGLVSISNNNTYEQVIQGCYRLRKLRSGQSIEFVIYENNLKNGEEVFKQINERTKKSIKDMNGLLNQQFVQWYAQINHINNIDYELINKLELEDKDDEIYQYLIDLRDKCKVKINASFDDAKAEKNIIRQLGCVNDNCDLLCKLIKNSNNIIGSVQVNEKEREREKERESEKVNVSAIFNNQKHSLCLNIWDEEIDDIDKVLIDKVITFLKQKQSKCVNIVSNIFYKQLIRFDVHFIVVVCDYGLIYLPISNHLKYIKYIKNTYGYDAYDIGKEITPYHIILKYAIDYIESTNRFGTENYIKYEYDNRYAAYNMSTTNKHEDIEIINKYMAMPLDIINTTVNNIVYTDNSI